MSSPGFPMEKRQPIEAISGETHLPQEIIQHIQSFLSGKEAARTTILSKSWYHTWLTLPNLDFSERDFGMQCIPLFEKFANKTFQRYDELNSRIQSFKLSMDVCESGNISLAKELIMKALKLGATNLSLSRVYIESNTTFWDIISSGFPCLKELALEDCFSYGIIQICSNSLESVNITHTSTSKLYATFDVPRIRKFKYSGSRVPSVSLKTISREWESDITITINSTLFIFSWLLDLSEFLHRLSSSKISLYLCTLAHVYGTQDVTWVTRKPPIAVEKFTYAPSSVFHPAVLDGLFTCCRPRFLSLHWLPSRYVKGKSNNDFKELLCKTLIKMKGSRHDLEEVNVEDAPIQKVDYLGSIKMQVCLQLKWGMSL